MQHMWVRSFYVSLEVCWIRTLMVLGFLLFFLIYSVQMAREILVRAYKHGHDMGGKKNYKIWVSSYSGVLFWRLHFFGFSNSVSKVKRYVQCCAVGTDSRYLIWERDAHSTQPSQAIALFSVDNFISRIYHPKGTLINKTSP